MNPSLLRIGIAVLMIAHGLVHVSLTLVPVPAPGSPPTPFWPAWWREATDPTWPISRLGLPSLGVRLLGSALWVGALAGFVLAGVGLLGAPGLNGVWPTLAGVAAVLSLILLGFYWHPWLVIGALLSLACLAAVWAHWPPSLFPPIA